MAQPDETPRKPIVIPYLEGAGHCTGQGMAGATAPGTGELGVPSLPPACDSAQRCAGVSDRNRERANEPSASESRRVRREHVGGRQTSSSDGVFD